MGVKRSGGQLLLVFALIWGIEFSLGATNPNDVTAINSLYTSLGSPVLPGWVASGGDPCGEAWQGVQCENSVILSIVLNGANLGGELGNNLGTFSSIRSLDLSSNHIGGSIPSSLPATLRTFFLAANNFTGSIPDSLSSLSLLTALSLNNNLLSGEIPDSFQSLAGLINLDLSSNNFTGKLPPSFSNLNQLTTLRLQDNRLSGTLDVLQDLPLQDLNIENNLFSGPIPQKMLSIPTFNKGGNPFNATVSPFLAPPPPAILQTTPPPSRRTPGTQTEAPSSSPSSGNNSTKTKKIVGISIGGAVVSVVFLLALLLCIPKCRKRREESTGSGFFKRHQVGASQGNNREHPRDNNSNLLLPTSQPPIEKDPKEVMAQAKKDNPVLQESPERDLPKQNDHGIDLSRLESTDMNYMPPTAPPPPPPPPPPPVQKVVVKPLVPAKPRNVVTSVKTFTVASLQQYTNSFSPENLIGGGMLGTVYRAELPDGKLLAVKKLDKKAASLQEDEFLELVNNIDRIRHANIVELMGYCAEHDQRLLIYEYCSNGTLQDLLHLDDELKDNLTWTSRIRLALGAARALAYLHEVCQPSVVHRNFKSANILLDDDLDVRVSDCGLATLISTGSVSQLSGQLLTAYGYGAPEFESGIYTVQSDVYSFGVVMLELLTGRKSYDQSRNRGEQFLVRWAIPQLHDIDALSRMVDPSLDGQYPAKSLSHFADIISRCVQSEPEFRPQMSEVVQDITNMIRKERPSSESIGD